MSLHPRPDFAIPEETQRVAHAAFPKGTLCLRIVDELGSLYRDDQFADLFPTHGQPATSPARLAFVSLLQYVEGLSDRQAAAGSAMPVTPIVVSVDASNQTFLNNELIPQNELRSRLIASLRKSSKQEVILRADQASPYKNVLKALVEITQAGATNVHLAYEEDGL